MIVVPDFKNESGEWVKTKVLPSGRVRSNSFRIWDSMTHRCKPNNPVVKKYPSYEGCCMSENFKDFQFFTEWCQSQTGYGIEGHQLDKDLLFTENKVYSENTCVFVPNAINSLFIRPRLKRGIYRQGVIFEEKRNKFRAQMSFGKSKAEFLGYYDSEEEAYNKYKEVKTEFVRSQAEVYKSILDPRLYTVLSNFEYKEI